MTIFHILKKHGITNPALTADLQGFVTAKEVESFENGVKQGKAAQAIVQLQAQDRFTDELREKHQQLIKKIKKIVEEF